MLTSNNRPMLGTTRNGGTRRYEGGSRTCMVTMATIERRRLRSAEAVATTHDIDAELLADDAPFLPTVHLDQESVWLYEDSIESEARAAAGDDDLGCLCRRCLLHDDPGGCLVAVAELEPERLPAPELELGTDDPRFRLTDEDLPGWGTAVPSWGELHHFTNQGAR